jgi:competence protein ComEC
MKNLRSMARLNTIRLAAALVTIAATTLVPSAVNAAPSEHKGAMRIAAIDVEGGQATLFVAPGGQSLLVDTGWAGNSGRDADRIVAAAHDFGLSRIDTVLITHFHSDHVGGVPQLAQRIPIGQFLDHGDVYEKGDGVPELYAAYLATVGQHKRLSPHAGDKLPAPGFDGTVISSDGLTMQNNLPGAGKPNDTCGPLPKLQSDTTENGHSLGFVLRFVGLNIMDAGDLTIDAERPLVCPVNHIGHIDLAIVSHHGSDLSSSKVFVHSLHPRVAIMDNGERKGGSTSVIDTWRSAPGLEALYQLHAAPTAGMKNPAGTPQEGPEHNVPEAFIANRVGEDGKRIDITVNADGSIDVLNQRTGDVKHFQKR